MYIWGVPPESSISTQEQKCAPAEEPPRTTTYPHKYSLSHYLVDKPDPELRAVHRLIRHQDCTLTKPGFMAQRSIVLYLNRKNWTTQGIHDDLVAILGAEAIA
jgi:hypothetical protein